MTLASSDIKACCTTAYSSEAVRFLLGDSFHPGGAALTARLGRALAVGSGKTIADIASGLGTSAIQIASERGCRVVGVELSAENVRLATRAAEEAGVGERVRFVCGDAERLPLERASIDGAICECALCTFPDKTAAAREFARVLRPGSRVAISDISAHTSELPEELTGLDARVGCIADAWPLDEIAALLEQGGLEVELLEPHDDALAEMLDRIDARLRLAALVGHELFGDALTRGRVLVSAARTAFEDGLLGYGVVVARRP